ncbi:sugar diacid recognition domain-containing protein [Desulfospira joergensenii]|uniref:sugar diacid recognition domain-containing protein n=1 Tax=Desulfospira joergensenii TaxID=53329 RepID=UPI0003B509F1|nr:sugar diacid recognition domain-containing protein [Desulfospira joergensenii]
MGIEDRFWQMAEAFVSQVKQESGYPVIVCDEAGVIRIASDRTRLGDTHAGAQKIMSGEVDEVLVTAEDALENPLVKEGYNCVIQAGQKRVGTFGLAGDVDRVKSLARISSLVMTSWVNELEQKEQIDQTSQRVFSSADVMTDKNRDISERTKTIFQEIEKSAGQVLENVKVTDDILKTIQDISSMSNILSINGTIEASRAGEQGRAFAVVAQEMREMSKATKEAALTIEKNMGIINGSIEDLNQTLEAFSGISVQQNEMIDETIVMINEFKDSLLRLKQGG